MSANSASVRRLTHLRQLGPSPTAKAGGRSVPSSGFLTFQPSEDSLFRSFQFTSSQSIFDQRIIFAVYLDWTQRDNLASARMHDADVLALQNSRKDRSQTLSRLRGRHCLHTLIILSPFLGARSRVALYFT